MRTRIFLALSFLAAAAACGDVATSSPGSTGATGATASSGGGGGTGNGASNATTGSAADAGPSTTTGTPASAGSSGCSTSSDCQGPGGPGGHCQAPGIADRGCGGPADIVTTTCTADPDCADAGAGLGPQVCELDPCARILGSDDDSPIYRCTYACTSDEVCDNGLTCQGGHCVMPSCATDADCGPNFSCTGQACVRNSCESDSECSGFCVDGACSSVVGECSPDAG